MTFIMSQDTFTRFVGDFGDWSWVVLFANQPFDDVLHEYCQMTQEEPGEPIPVAAGQHTHNPSGAVVELADSNWTMVLHRVGVWEEFGAGALAHRLRARVILFHAEDTSGSTGCSDIAINGTVTNIQTQSDLQNEQELYDCMEEFEEEMGTEMSRPEPGKIVDNYDDYFKEQGISLVCVSLDDSRSTAIVSTGDEQKIGRVILAGDPTGG